MSLICCKIRKEWVEATPEEGVRQHLLTYMIDTLGFPPAHISVEKALDQMPHLALSNKTIPNRRADIVCFAEKIHPQHSLYPLLLIECKAVKLNRKEYNQVISYNQSVQAYFIALANHQEIVTGWYEKTAGAYQFMPNLPAYKDLLQGFR